MVVWLDKYHYVKVFILYLHHCIPAHTSRMSCSRTVLWTWCDLGSLNWTAKSDLSPSEHLWDNWQQRFSQYRSTTSPFDTTVGSIWPVWPAALWNTSDTLKSQWPDELWWFRTGQDWMELCIKPLFLYYFVHYMYTNTANFINLVQISISENRRWLQRVTSHHQY